MATNYTANYGLCQWEPEDNFLREEFNQDNAKIDAALAGHDADFLAMDAAKLSYTTLQDITVPETVQQVEFDPKAGQWWQYSVILLVYTPAPGSSGGTLTLSPVNSTINTAYHTVLTSNDTSRKEYLAEGSVSAPLTVLFFPGKYAQNTVQALSFVASSFSVGYSGSQYQNLEPICLKSAEIPVGSRIRITGVL